MEKSPFLKSLAALQSNTLVFYLFSDRNNILHCNFMLTSFKSRSNWVDSTEIKTDKERLTLH